MTSRNWWRLTEIVSQRLEPDEREAVYGDLVESGASGYDAFNDVLGLVIRRELSPWKRWRPWLVFVGLLVPVTLVLRLSCDSVNLGFDLDLWLLRNYRDIDPSGPLVRNCILELTRWSSVLFVWSWLSGFVLGAMSRRTVWFNQIFFLLAALHLRNMIRDGEYMYGVRGWVLPLVFYTALLPLILKALLILIPIFVGMRQGMQPPTRQLQAILWIAAVIVVLLLRPWLLPKLGQGPISLLLVASYWLVVYGPLVYLTGSAVEGRLHRRI